MQTPRPLPMTPVFFSPRLHIPAFVPVLSLVVIIAVPHAVIIASCPFFPAARRGVIARFPFLPGCCVEASAVVIECTQRSFSPAARRGVIASIPFLPGCWVEAAAAVIESMRSPGGGGGLQRPGRGVPEAGCGRDARRRSCFCRWYIAEPSPSPSPSITQSPSPPPSRPCPQNCT